MCRRQNHWLDLWRIFQGSPAGEGVLQPMLDKGGEANGDAEQLDSPAGAVGMDEGDGAEKGGRSAELFHDFIGAVGTQIGIVEHEGHL